MNTGEEIEVTVNEVKNADESKTVVCDNLPPALEPYLADYSQEELLQDPS